MQCAVPVGGTIAFILTLISSFFLLERTAVLLTDLLSMRRTGGAELFSSLKTILSPCHISFAGGNSACGPLPTLGESRALPPDCICCFHLSELLDTSVSFQNYFKLPLILE